VTLIIFARYRDGTIVISDRQGSVFSGEKRSVKKIYFSENKEYFLALAGDGSRIEQIHSMLDELNIVKNEIRSKLKPLIDQTHFKTSQEIEGILLIKNKINYDHFRVATDYDKTRIVKLDSPFECYGLSGAKSVADYLARFGNLENYDLEKAIDYLLAIMNSVSQNFDGISTIDEGFDILAISDLGDIYERLRFKKRRTGKLVFSFKKSKHKILPELSKTSLLVKVKSKKKSKPRRKVQRKLKRLEKIPESITIPTSQPMAIDYPPRFDLITKPLTITTSILNQKCTWKRNSDNRRACRFERYKM